MTIRDLKPDDDVVSITEMLHRAYASLAARGLRYFATYQSPDETHDRLARGHPFLAESNGRVVGTITVYKPNPDSSIPAYRDSGTFHFGQFGVDPDFKGRGIGRALHEAAVAHALEQRAFFMALDTAGPAKELISMYERWGYTVVDRTQWDVTNYESVVMRRALKRALNQTEKPASPAAVRISK
jgi:GNAT superfamily N-acetyltransferase